MAQRHSLKVREIDKVVNGKRYHYFQVAHYEGDRRVREFFPDQAAADKALRNLKDKEGKTAERTAILKTRIGRQAAKLSDNDLLDATRGLNVLKRCATLTKAAEFFMKHNRPDGGHKLVEDIVSDYRESRIKAGRRDATIKDSDKYLTVFAKDFKGQIVSHLTTIELQRWVDTRNGGIVSRRQMRVHLVGLYNFGMRRKVCHENPATGIDVPTIPKHKPHILTVDDCQTLMATTAALYPGMVPYMAICLFAGVRPAEAARLNWKDIRFDKREIFIDSSISKTHDDRWVQMSDNLVQWLLPHREREGLIPFVRFQFDEIREKSKVQWKSDCLRHSFCSYHLALHENAGKTALQAGHRQLGTLFEHYRRAVEKTDAEQFWKISPPKESNVIHAGKFAG